MYAVVCSDITIMRCADIAKMTAVMSRLSLSVGWENGPERGLKTVSFNL